MCSYPERWRDWPDETRQPFGENRIGANSCRSVVFWKIRAPTVHKGPLLLEEAIIIRQH